MQPRSLQTERNRVGREGKGCRRRRERQQELTGERGKEGGVCPCASAHSQCDFGAEMCYGATHVLCILSDDRGMLLERNDPSRPLTFLTYTLNYVLFGPDPSHFR
eukprot:2782696-Rhodomonas_salina.3